jgi:hypothetical protein
MLSASRLRSVGWWMNAEWIRKEAVVAESKYYPGIYLEGLSKTIDALSQDSLFPAGIL